MPGSDNDLVARVFEIQAQANKRRVRGTQATEHATQDDETKFAGADEESMFSLDEYGGRCCVVCGTSIDGYRSHAMTCSDSCRARGWRIEQKAGA